MISVQNSSELSTQIARWRAAGDNIAFVPTMGNLHQGHVKLLQIASRHASKVVMSIFVNPLQFNNQQDLLHYPRTLQQDSNCCKQHGVDLLFVPDMKDIYPLAEATPHLILPELKTICEILEGASRPRHFSGVLTVVKRLFELVTPHYAIFGEKDFQQLRVIQQMVGLLKLNITVIPVATEREQDGLAMSSRNSYLTSVQRKKANLLYKTLHYVRDSILQGDCDYNGLVMNASNRLDQAGFRTDYIRVCETQNLAEARPECDKRVILAAAWLGKARLIDNLMI